MDYRCVGCGEYYNSYFVHNRQCPKVKKPFTFRRVYRIWGLWAAVGFWMLKGVK